MKACLASGYIPRTWRQVTLTFIPATQKAKHTQAKAYSPIILLSFMQKTIQKLEIWIIRDETFGHDIYNYKNRPTKQISSKKAKCTM